MMMIVGNVYGDDEDFESGSSGWNPMKWSEKVEICGRKNDKVNGR